MNVEFRKEIGRMPRRIGAWQADSLRHGRDVPQKGYGYEAMRSMGNLDGCSSERAAAGERAFIRGCVCEAIQRR